MTGGHLTRLRTIVVALLLATLGTSAAFALTDAPSTLTVCATTPAHTIQDNGSTLAVIPGASRCATTTVPTVTVTTTTVADLTTTTTTSTDTTSATLCDRTAPAGGSAQALVDALAPGQTGCLPAGTYTGNVTIRTPAVTLTSAPGGTATVHGIVYVPPAATDVTIDRINVDARGASQVVAVQLFASRAHLLHADVSGGDQDRIGVQVGYSTLVTGVEVAYCRVHDFGVPDSGSIYDHGIYVDNADGTDVHDNVIVRNGGGYGIQLWTHSMNGRFTNNTLADNSAGNIIIAGDTNQIGGPSSGNTFARNILASPQSGLQTQLYWGAGNAGTNNTVSDNVYFGGSFTAGAGVAYSANVQADPMFAADYSLLPGSPAAGYGAR